MELNVLSNDEMMEKLSIIIPVYNVEKYLAKCLDSILVDNAFTGQVVCVNDGSTDDSLAILEQYAKKYSNIEIIIQTNAGLSAARNAGIKVAKGDYVCFLDSDDYWEPNVLGRLMQQIERDKLDVLRFKYQNVNERYEIFQPYKRDSILDNDYSGTVTDGVSFLNERMNTQCYAVMFIVKREILDDCLFTEGIYFEDVDWTPRMLVKSKRVASTNTIVYNYLIREGSITRAVTRSKKIKVLNDLLYVISSLQQQALKLQSNGVDNHWYQNMIASTVIGVVVKASTDFYEERKRIIRQICELHVLPIKPISLKAYLINFSLRIAIEMLHLKNINL